MKTKEYEYVSTVGMGIRNVLWVHEILHPDPKKEPPMSSFLADGPAAKWDDRFYGLIYRSGELCDFISFGCNNKHWVVSERVAAFLDQELGEDQVLLRPLPLRDKAGELQINGYYFPIWKHMPNCIIRKLSGVTGVRYSKRIFLSFQHSRPGGPLTIHKDIVGDSKIFRPLRLEIEVIVRNDIVRKIKKLGFTGFNYMKRKEFPVIPVNKDILVAGWREDGRSEAEIERLIEETEIMDFEPGGPLRPST